MTYQKGDLRKYQLKVMKLVKSGEIDKPEANIMILCKVQQILANLCISKEQFMLDRKMESINVS